MVSCLVLYKHVVTYSEGLQFTGMFTPSLASSYMSLPESVFLFRKVSCQVGCPVKIGTNSFIGRPITHIAGGSPVSGSGVFRQVRTAQRNESVSRESFVPVFHLIILLTVFTPTSVGKFE